VPLLIKFDSDGKFKNVFLVAPCEEGVRIPPPLRVAVVTEKGTRCLGNNWATLSLGDINTETWSSRLGPGRMADDISMQKIIVAKPIEVHTGWSNSQDLTNLAESSKKGYVSKRSVQPMIINSLWQS
jgi:hypothetical protein